LPEASLSYGENSYTPTSTSVAIAVTAVQTTELLITTKSI